MSGLQYFGFFDEHGLVSPDGSRSRILSALGEPGTAETALIVQYLNEGWICLELFDDEQRDVQTGEPLPQVRILTDGEWVWPNFVAHYVEKHGLAVPSEFVERMRANQWHVPAVTDEAFNEVVDMLIGSAPDDAGLQEILDMLSSEGGER